VPEARFGPLSAPGRTALSDGPAETPGRPDPSPVPAPAGRPPERSAAPARRDVRPRASRAGTRLAVALPTAAHGRDPRISRRRKNTGTRDAVVGSG